MFLAFTLLADERFVDVRNDTAAGNGGLDEGVQLFVTTDGQLQVPGSDTLHFQIFGSISSQLENLEKNFNDVNVAIRIKSVIYEIFKNQ